MNGPAWRFTVEGFEFFVRETRTRFPFRYGIASMTEVPHLFVRVRIGTGTATATGLTSEGLPPKWFTKNPKTTFAQDLPEMLGQIRHAVAMALEVGRQSQTFFDFWQQVYRSQNEWAAARGMAPLLANLGVSLVERAILDALCRHWEKPLHRAVRENCLGLRLGQVHSELANSEPRDWLPASASSAVLLRHTLGLGDPLTASEIAAGERVDDGLPQDLESSVRFYGLRAFKIKLAGDAATDRVRLSAVARLLPRMGPKDYRVTLDGNENFRDFHSFREFWEQLMADSALQELSDRVVAIEQPVHRDQALQAGAGEVLRDWKQRPPVIIDESDGALEDLPRALALGYDGTSHKNCKGLVKGLANAALLAWRRAQGLPGLLTGEDLCNLGPVALLQDLASMALLGIPHVERNGHHYFRGLSMWPAEWQDAARAAHPDIYGRDPDGLVRLKITQGLLDLESVNAAPFGVSPLLDPAAFRFQTLSTQGE